MRKRKRNRTVRVCPGVEEEAGARGRARKALIMEARPGDKKARKGRAEEVRNGAGRGSRRSNKKALRRGLSVVIREGRLGERRNSSEKKGKRGQHSPGKKVSHLWFEKRSLLCEQRKEKSP